MNKGMVIIPVIALVALCISVPDTSFAQQTQELTVETGVICRGIVDREPADADTIFSADAGQLYCFTKIKGAEISTTITHVWYFGEDERARVELSVRSISWRTNSSKKIMEQTLTVWRRYSFISWRKGRNWSDREAYWFTAPAHSSLPWKHGIDCAFAARLIRLEG